ncbi:ArsR/SmtB family transcription factor [Brevibacterium aurantiacum]|uniref:ArsR/SmtB family transcription factor n=1 Tax=Brevibacterium aurantiacum TaxID=273384 RepID=UPI00084C8C8B|nr:winged helix-turn-helix domain-containing protein [Brevibacterium aurantiacum]
MSSSSKGQSARTVEERVAELERKIAELENAVPTTAPAAEAESDRAPNGTKSTNPTADDDTFWALNGLIDRAGDEGGVVYTGHTTPPGGESPVSWQMGLRSAAINDLNFAEAAPALAALGHPVRLELLQAIYEGTTTVAQLGEDERFGTTGQIYHHIHALAGAGWLENSRRGHWRVPGQKIIPLLTLILIGTH